MLHSTPRFHTLSIERFFVAKLPGKAKAEIGVVSLDEWNRLNQSAN
jgi:hypothetical protein